jgi:hypothetical protein
MASSRTGLQIATLAVDAHPITVAALGVLVARSSRRIERLRLCPTAADCLCGWEAPVRLCRTGID